MSDARWIHIEAKLPPENVEVDTLSPGGTQQRLVRQGNLWFFPDMSMYVYYRPLYWLPVSSPAGKPVR